MQPKIITGAGGKINNCRAAARCLKLDKPLASARGFFTFLPCGMSPATRALDAAAWPDI